MICAHSTCPPLHPAAAAAPSGVGATLGWLRRLRLRRPGGGVHVRALMQGIGSVKRYQKEGNKRRLRGDAGFANKADLPHRWELAAPLSRAPPPPPWTAEEGREGEGEREGRERGSEKERQYLVGGKNGAGREGAFTDTTRLPPFNQYVLLGLSPSRRRRRPCQRRNGQVIGCVGRARAWRGRESAEVN
jgi:hypothetical protein